MPIYAYRCPACDDTFEVRQRMVEDALTECPTCTGPIRRVIQNVPVVFKGSGWYINDSRKSANGKSEKSEKAASSDEKTGTETTAKKEPGEKASDKAAAAKTESAPAAAS